MNSDVDAQPFNRKYKTTTLPFEKRSTDNIRRENEQFKSKSPSDGKLTVSSESPLPRFRTIPTGQVDLLSAAGSSARILLYIAKESADAFGPLKSVLGGISAICDQYEVCFRTPVLRVTCS